MPVHIVTDPVDVVRLRLRFDTTQHRVKAFVGRISLGELDRRRGSDERLAAPGLAFYLMAPLGTREEDIPEDAISLIKVTISQIFGRPTVAAKVLKQLWSSTNLCKNTWALLETQDHTFAVRPADTGLSREYLSKAFTPHDHHCSAADGLEVYEPIRLLVEVSPKRSGGDESDWARLVERMVTDAPVFPEAPPSRTPLKDRLLANHVLSAAQAARRLGARAEDATSWASRKRRADELFGVWSSQDRTFVHPDFQFGDHITDAHRKTLFKTLRTRVGFDASAEDKGGWARAFWLYQPNAALSKAALAARDIDLSDPVTGALILNFVSDEPRAPAEVFGESPEDVIALAKGLSEREAARD